MLDQLLSYRWHVHGMPYYMSSRASLPNQRRLYHRNIPEGIKQNNPQHHFAQVCGSAALLA